VSYKVIIGNNFINNNPLGVYLFKRKLFSINKEKDFPYLSCKIIHDRNNNFIEIDKNKIIFSHDSISIKKNSKDHILLLNTEGEILIESRVVDRKTLIVSGIFSSKNMTCIITQNYVLLDGKRIMHSKIDSNNGYVTITDEGIRPFISKCS